MKTLIPQRIADRIDGFRGGFLLLLTGPWILVGLSYLVITTPGRSEAFSYLPEWINENELGWLWIVCGVLTTVFAFLGGGDPKWTTVGFLAGIIPPALWGVLFGISQAVGASPTAIVSVVMYGSFAAIIYYCSGWPNPLRQKPERGDECRSSHSQG